MVRGICFGLILIHHFNDTRAEVTIHDIILQKLVTLKENGGGFPPETTINSIIEDYNTSITSKLTEKNSSKLAIFRVICAFSSAYKLYHGGESVVCNKADPGNKELENILYSLNLKNDDSEVNDKSSFSTDDSDIEASGTSDYRAASDEIPYHDLSKSQGFFEFVVGSNLDDLILETIDYTRPEKLRYLGHAEFLRRLVSVAADMSSLPMMELPSWDTVKLLADAILLCTSWSLDQSFVQPLGLLIISSNISNGESSRANLITLLRSFDPEWMSSMVAALAQQSDDDNVQKLSMFMEGMVMGIIERLYEPAVSLGSVDERGIGHLGEEFDNQAVRKSDVVAQSRASLENELKDDDKQSEISTTGGRSDGVPTPKGPPGPPGPSRPDTPPNSSDLIVPFRPLYPSTGVAKQHHDGRTPIRPGERDSEPSSPPAMKIDSENPKTPPLAAAFQVSTERTVTGVRKFPSIGLPLSRTRGGLDIYYGLFEGYGSVGRLGGNNPFGFVPTSSSSVELLPSLPPMPMVPLSLPRLPTNTEHNFRIQFMSRLEKARRISQDELI